MEDRVDLHPICTVIGPGRTLSQGPTLNPVYARRPSSLPADMHGKLVLDMGGGRVAVGRPVRRVRGGSDG